MRYLLFIILVSFIFSHLADAENPGAIELVDIKKIPENVFVFGMFNIKKKEMFLGVPRKFAHMRGFHFEFLVQLSGDISSAEQMINKKRQGKYAGFGFIRQGDTIFLHRISSLKAAGKIEKIHTVNPLLPSPNPIWPAVLPRAVAREIFLKLAVESGLTLEIDADTLSSKRFVFNESKYGSKSSLMAKALVARVKLASLWLSDIVFDANERLLNQRLANCIKTQDASF